MNKKMLLVFALVSGFALAMRKSPAAVAKARAQAQRLIGQMRPGVANFDQLQDQVGKIIQDLRDAREARIANELRMALSDKVRQAVAKEKKEAYQEFVQERGIEQADLQGIKEAQEKEIKALQDELTIYKDAMENADETVQKYERILDDLVEYYNKHKAAYKGTVVEKSLKDYMP